jgi:hypothetical protein
MNRLFVAFAMLFFASPAAADAPTKQECVAANEAAQDLRRAGKLREAREKLAVCLDEGCPKAVRDDCAQRRDEVDKAMARDDASNATKPPSERGDVGETCAKRDDCKAGLRCRNEKCARADDAEEQPRRGFGLGIGFGGGVGVGTLRVNKTLDDTSASPEIILPPTAEFSWYLPGEHAINLYIPLLNNLIGSGLVGGFVWNTDVMFTFNVGSGDLRFVTGPGVGFTLLVGTISSNGQHATAGGFRIPGEAAVEYLWANHTWGVKLGARPWIEISSERLDPFLNLVPGSTINTTGGGILLMLTFTRFTLKQGEPP